MQKFENVDVIAALGEIMRQNTAFYQSDFDIDKGIIQRAAASDQAVDKTLLWMSRPSGTYCFRERDVFLKGTRQHNTWRFYGEQTRDKILAYAVELTGTKDDTIRGNLYELDYQQHFRHVIDAALPVSVSRLTINNTLCLSFNPAVMQSRDMGLEISRPCLLPSALLLL